MRTVKLSKIFSFIFIVYSMLGYSQTPQMNLQKYWKYKERLKNFVVVGDCVGCSLPIKDRSGDGTISWTDETITLGHYIGMLSMEYKMLENNGQNLQQIKEELYYAIEAFNRIDYMAEYYYNGTKSLNGFFIRDDIHSNFFDLVYKGKLVENYLNQGLTPPPDGWKLKTVNSGYDEGIAIASGPVEESQDQVIQLYLGFALATKFLNPNAQYSIPFMDGEIKFVQEVKNISQRIYNHMSAGGSWLIRNPAHNNDCVAGVTTVNDRNCTNTANGAYAGLLAYGFAKANCYIQGANCDISLGLLNKPLWDGLYKTTAVGNGQDFKVLTLAAIADPWGASTSQIITDRCSAVYSEHLPMVYQALHGGNSSYPNAVYECMLNVAPCWGNNGHDGNYEWSGGERVLYGPNVGGTSYSSEFSGLDYLFYFNLYNLLNPTYLNGTFHIINPKELCPIDLEKTNYSEEDSKNFTASNSISSGSIPSNNQGYTIQDDPTDVPFHTEVTFEAGNVINLLPGFSVMLGATFSATIDPSLQAMSCSNNGANTICTLCKPTGDEQQSNQSNYGTYKIYPVKPNEVYAATPHYLFKLNNTGGTGENMFGIVENNGQYQSTSTSNYLIGYQRFDNEISDVDYINGYTFVSFKNGSMLKISDTGGTGQNMFAVTELSNNSANAFDNIGSYYSGDQKFNSGITNTIYVNGELLIGLSSGKMLKINGTGGTGHNMFAVTELNNSANAFNNIGTYYAGDQKFSSGISIIATIGAKTIIGLYSGKTLKINGTGGTGHNMFAVNETGSGFNSLNGYAYYAGDQKFNAPIIDIALIGGYSFISFNNGKILKLDAGVGGTGHTMFAVNETPNGFNTMSGYSYYKGSDKFYSVVTSIIYSNNSTLIGFSNGKILKIVGTGGTGNSMFNAVEVNRGFTIKDLNYSNYIQGSMSFNVAVTELNIINNNTFIGLGNGKVFKLIGNGGTGFNLYGLSDDNCMKNLCGYNYLIGCQNFASINAK
jgi:hypothetical protein